MQQKFKKAAVFTARSLILPFTAGVALGHFVLKGPAQELDRRMRAASAAMEQREKGNTELPSMSFGKKIPAKTPQLQK